MNCIITLKINDYFPKVTTIPYDNFICLFTYGDFYGRIPLKQKSNCICKHEIQSVTSDIKYNIRVLQNNDSSLIGMSELLIPLIKLKQINAPGSMTQNQLIKLITDGNTKRKLFGTIINSEDISLDISAVVFMPEQINCSNEIMEKINNKKVNELGKSTDGTSPRTLKKRKMLMEMNYDREMIKTDNSINNSSTDINCVNRVNVLKVFDFRNKKDKIDLATLSKQIYNMNNNVNSNDNKKTHKRKFSPKKKVTILELMEEKMQPKALSSDKDLENKDNVKINLNKKNNIINKKVIIKNKIISGNKKSNNKNNIIHYNINKINQEEKKYNLATNNINPKQLKKPIFPKINNSQDNNINKSNNTKSQITKNLNRSEKFKTAKEKDLEKNIEKNQSRKKTNSANKNNRRNNINPKNKLTKDFPIYSDNIISYSTNTNTNFSSAMRNTCTSEEVSKKNKYGMHMNDEEFIKKVENKIASYKKPKMDSSSDNLPKKIKKKQKLNNVVQKNKNSNFENTSKSNTDISINQSKNENNTIISCGKTIDKTYLDIDKIILEKGALLRETFEDQMSSNKKEICYSSIKEKKNWENNLKAKKVIPLFQNNEKKDFKINTNRNNLVKQFYLSSKGDLQIIDSRMNTMETPKCCNINTYYTENTEERTTGVNYVNLGNNNINLLDQNDVKNNILNLIDLYYLLNKKLIKYIYYNNELNQKLFICKEHFFNLTKIATKIDEKTSNKSNNYFTHVNINHSINNKFIEKFKRINILEKKICQNIFKIDFNDYDLIKIKEIDRVQKLNEERKINILLTIIRSIIKDCGNISQIFHTDIKKENLLKIVLGKYGIFEKKEGDAGYINFRNIDFNKIAENKMKEQREHKYFESKIIKEVDEEKEDEEESKNDDSSNQKNRNSITSWNSKNSKNCKNNKYENYENDSEKDMENNEQEIQEKNDYVEESEVNKEITEDESKKNNEENNKNDHNIIEKNNNENSINENDVNRYNENENSENDNSENDKIMDDDNENNINENDKNESEINESEEKKNIVSENDNNENNSYDEEVEVEEKEDYKNNNVKDEEKAKILEVIINKNKENIEEEKIQDDDNEQIEKYEEVENKEDDKHKENEENNQEEKKMNEDNVENFEIEENKEEQKINGKNKENNFIVDSARKEYDEEKVREEKEDKKQKEQQKINLLKEELLENFPKKYDKINKSFSHIKNDEFLFDDKHLTADFDENNEIVIFIDDNKYNLDQFVNNFCINITAEDENSKNNRPRKRFLYKRRAYKERKIENEGEKKEENEEVVKENKEENKIEENNHKNEYQRKRWRRKVNDDNE